MTEEDGVLFGRIVIERRATDNDLLDWVTAEDAFGNDLGLAEALGMLRLAEHTLIDQRLRDYDEGDEDEG